MECPGSVREILTNEEYIQLVVPLCVTGEPEIVTGAESLGEC